MRSSRRTVTRLRTLVGVLAVGGFAVPAAAVAQPLQDSVAGTESTPFFQSIAFDAHSGPSGENPTGQVTFTFSGATFQGAVTCLAVNGNVAVVNTPVTSLGVFVTWQVTDSPNGAPDVIEFQTIPRTPSDCSPPVGGSREVTFGGGLVVTDAPPFPTSKDQ